MITLFILLISIPLNGVRVIEASACDVTDVKLSAGLSTLLQFDEEPKLSFHADPEHFLLKTDEAAKRSLAIIPHIKDQDLKQLIIKNALFLSFFNIKRLQSLLSISMKAWIKRLSCWLIFNVHHKS